MKIKDKRLPPATASRVSSVNKTGEKALYDVLRQKVSDLVMKNPKKAALIMSTWVNVEKKLNQSCAATAKKKKAA